MRHGEVFLSIIIELSSTKILPLKAKFRSKPSLTCCRPSITRKCHIIIDHPLKPITRIQPSKLIRTFSDHFSGMKNRSASLEDRLNSSNIINKKNWSLEFSKRSLLMLEASLFPLNPLPKKRQLNSKFFLPIQLIANNLSNSSNKKLKMSVGNKKNSSRLFELKFIRIN